MKNLIIILILTIIGQLSFGQNCDAVLGLGPGNDYTGLMSRGMSTTINQWDWTIEDYSDIYYSSTSGVPEGPYSIRSPFFHQGGNGYRPFTKCYRSSIKFSYS